MKRKTTGAGVLGLLLCFYAFLYLATSRDVPCETDECFKLESIDSLLKKNPGVAHTGRCHTNRLCIQVDDINYTRNWKGIADTACMYLKEKGLHHFSVDILSTRDRGDTIHAQDCP